MRVGTSILLTISSSSDKDHPHACGDKLTVRVSTMTLKGSSPCVWGQAISVKISPQMAGIIPMRVGTSAPVFFFNFRLRDHPHACGDKSEYQLRRY